MRGGRKSEATQQKIDAADSATFYLLQELGPMAFLLRESSDGVGNSAVLKFKVGLGSRQTCTCTDFLSTGEVCMHIIWVLLKVFRVPKENDILFQKGLVEREIAEIMQLRNKKVDNVAKDRVFTDIQIAKIVEHVDKEVKDSCSSHTHQRPMEDGDVCPICLEDIFKDAQTCCDSCGNNIHINCTKVLLEHQTKSLGVDVVKCPLCRRDFGSAERVKKEWNQALKSRLVVERRDHKHYGTIF